MTNLQRIREERGLSVYRLHKLTGLSQTALSNIENGTASTLQMRYINLMKLADALNVNVVDLIDFE